MKHAHFYSASNGLHACLGCERDAIVCPECGLCTLCAAGIDPEAIYGRHKG